MVHADAGKCVCGGLGRIEVGEEEEATISFLAARNRRVAKLYRVARQALAMVRVYRAEGDLGGHRERACLAGVAAYRKDIAMLRAMRPADVDAILEVALGGELSDAAA